MRMERFLAILEAYGAVPERWPQAEREAAEAFAAAEPEAGRALAEAAALDRALDAAPKAAPSRALFEAVLASAPRPRARAVGPGWRLEDWLGWALGGGGVGGAIALRPALALGVILALGLASGYLGASQQAAMTADQTLLAYAFSSAESVFSVEG